MGKILRKFTAPICFLLFLNLPVYAAGERQRQLLDVVQLTDSLVKSGGDNLISFQMMSECLSHAVSLADGEEAGVTKWSTPKFRLYKSPALAQTAYCRAIAEANLKYLEKTRAHPADIFAMRSLVDVLADVLKKMGGN